MKNGLLEIDHLLTKVESPDRAGDHFERLGFTVTPLSLIESMGLCNRLVLFKPLTEGSANFIELMGVSHEAKVPPSMAELLQGPAGIRSMVMATPDAHAARAELVSNGYPFGDVHHIAREWKIPGQSLDVKFDVLLPVPAPLKFNICRYYTLQHYIRSDWIGHANGIVNLEAVYCTANDTRQTLQYYEALFGVAATGSDARGWTVSPNNVQLTIFSPQAWEKNFDTPAVLGFTGYRLRSKRLATTAEFMKAAGVPITVRHAGDMLIAPERMFGCCVHIC